MSTRITLTTISLGLALSLGACAQPQTEEASSPLSIAVHSDTRITGTFDAGDIEVGFVAEMPKQYVGEVSVSVRGKTLTLFANAYAGVIDFNANDAELLPDEKGALAAFRLAIRDYLGDPADTSVMHESLLARAAEYFAEAPARTPLAAVNKAVTPLAKDISFSNGNDGKRCIDIGDRETAKFDGSNGYHEERWTVGADGGEQWSGDYECMGRCGQGCGSYDWTLDCLDHDACSRKYYSTAGPVDHNCGDEYANAADDYTNFWKRCRG